MAQIKWNRKVISFGLQDYRLYDVLGAKVSKLPEDREYYSFPGNVVTITNDYIEVKIKLISHIDKEVTSKIVRVSFQYVRKRLDPTVGYFIPDRVDDFLEKKDSSQEQSKEIEKYRDRTEPLTDAMLDAFDKAIKDLDPESLTSEHRIEWCDSCTYATSQFHFQVKKNKSASFMII